MIQTHRRACFQSFPSLAPAGRTPSSKASTASVFQSLVRSHRGCILMRCRSRRVKNFVTKARQQLHSFRNPPMMLVFNLWLFNEIQMIFPRILPIVLNLFPHLSQKQRKKCAWAPWAILKFSSTSSINDCFKELLLLSETIVTKTLKSTLIVTVTWVLVV